jgi:hypothetical protein
MKDPIIQQLIEMVQKVAPVIKKLPKPPEFKSADKVRWESKEEVKCSGCNTYSHIGEFKSVSTGYITAFDPVCKSCRSEIAGTCPIVCVPCKTVVSRMKPHKDTSGFVFEKDKAYHTDRCPACSEDCKTSFLIEKAAYDKDK